MTVEQNPNFRPRF